MSFCRIVADRDEEDLEARKRKAWNVTIEMFFEPVNEAFREGFLGTRVYVGVLKDVVEEFVGEGGEIVDLRGRLRRKGRSA